MKIEFDETTLTVNILRLWPRDKVIQFAQHLLGEDCQKCYKYKKNEGIPHLDVDDYYKEPRN